MAALTRGEWEPAREFGERLRARAERDDDQVLWVESDYLRGIAAYWPGRLTEARGHFEAAMERFRPERRRAHVLRYGQDPELLVRLRLAHTLWLLGHPGEADRQRDLALRAAGESSHAYSRAAAWVWAAIVAMDRGEVAEFRRHVRELTAAPADEGPAQVRLAAELFAGHLSVLEAERRGARRECGRSARSYVSARAPAPGLPGVATRLLLEGYAADRRAAARAGPGPRGAGHGPRGGAVGGRDQAAARDLPGGGSARAGEVTAELERALAVARRQQARRSRSGSGKRSRNAQLSHGGARPMTDRGGAMSTTAHQCGRRSARRGSRATCWNPGSPATTRPAGLQRDDRPAAGARSRAAPAPPTSSRR